MRLVAMVLVSFLGACAVGAQTPTPGNLTDYLNTLNDEQRDSLLRGSARQGAYFPGIDYCPYLDDIAEFDTYFSVTPEPFGTLCISKLAVLLASLAPEDARNAAATLYRHGHPSGRTYLIEAVRRKSDQKAAAILAMNRESEPLDRIVGASRRAEYPSLELIAALATWGLPEAKAGLLEKFRESPGNPDLMLGVGVAGITDAVDALQDQHRSAQASDSRKVAAAGALARLATDRATHLAYLKEQLSVQPPFEMWRIDVISALGVAGGSEAEALLSAIVMEYNATDAIAGVSTEVAAKMSVSAAKSLAYLNAQGSNAAVRGLFRKLAGPVQVSGIDRKRGLLGNVLLDLDPTNGEEAIRSEMGDRWLQRLLAVRALKRVPRSMAPSKSRDFENYRECFWCPN